MDDPFLSRDTILAPDHASSISYGMQQSKADYLKTPGEEIEG